MEKKNYFGMMFFYFDTRLIYPNLVRDLEELQRKFPQSKSHEQGYFNVLTQCIWDNNIPLDKHRGYSRVTFKEERSRKLSDYVFVKYCDRCKDRPPKKRRE